MTVAITPVAASAATAQVVRAGVAIPTTDGVTLAGYLWTPVAASGYPLLVMPSSWGGDRNDYDAIAQNSMNAGYAVLAYAQRGFGASTGSTDAGASATQGDVSTVITWALAHTAADPARVGVLGLSFGAGVGLLAAAKDRRIRSVVALSTWADYASAMYPNKTLKLNILSSLMSKATRVTSEVAALKTAVSSNVAAVPAVLGQLAPTRSPAQVVSGLNANGPAIMIVNAMQDSLFPADQVGSMFAKLTTPKRLLLIPGDHMAAMTPSALVVGGPWTSIADWLAHYLGGVSNHATTDAQVTITDAANGVKHGYSSWAAAQSSTTMKLGAVGTTPGALGTTTSSSWTRTLTTGYATYADSGPQQLSVTSNYVPPRANMTSVGTAHAWMWNGANTSANMLVAGVPTVHLTITPKTSSATVYAYLYDVVTSTSVGTLMSAQPYTLSGAQAGTAKSVTFSMQPVSRTLAAGHHLTLVVDTVDARYVSANPAGSTIGLGSSASDAAWLSVGAN